ncbi:MAG: TOBE domain-containing protein [Methanothrix sp.]
MKISARNILKGSVKGIVNGPVSTEVTVLLSGGEEMVSTITRASAQNLELKEGKEVLVVIKASNVMIATD